MAAPLGSRPAFCDGVSRRGFLQIGGWRWAACRCRSFCRPRPQAGRRASHKSVIMIFLSGGPPHQDMVDLKMDAPAEIRGEFQPISTNVPGIQICEHLPRLAAMMDRLVPIRSLVGSEGRHAAFQCITGWPVQQSAGRRLAVVRLVRLEAARDRACRARRRSSACRRR